MTIYVEAKHCIKYLAKSRSVQYYIAIFRNTKHGHYLHHAEDTLALMFSLAKRMHVQRRVTAVPHSALPCISSSEGSIQVHVQRTAMLVQDM